MRRTSMTFCSMSEFSWMLNSSNLVGSWTRSRVVSLQHVIRAEKQTDQFRHPTLSGQDGRTGRTPGIKQLGAIWFRASHTMPSGIPRSLAVIPVDVHHDGDDDGRAGNTFLKLAVGARKYDVVSWTYHRFFHREHRFAKNYAPLKASYWLCFGSFWKPSEQKSTTNTDVFGASQAQTHHIYDVFFVLRGIKHPHCFFKQCLEKTLVYTQFSACCKK